MTTGAIKQDVDWEAVVADQAMTIAMMKQREWVGLTDDDVSRVAAITPNHPDDNDLIALIKIVELMLKEKNQA